MSIIIKIAPKFKEELTGRLLLFVDKKENSEEPMLYKRSGFGMNVAPVFGVTFYGLTGGDEIDLEEQKDMRVPSELIPRCPKCGKPMTMNLRSDDTFVEDFGWHEAASRYTDYVQKHLDKPLLLLELGVGGNTPGIIKYPFWRITAQNPDAFYICLNFGEAECPRQIDERSICVNADIADVLEKLK